MEHITGGVGPEIPVLGVGVDDPAGEADPTGASAAVFAPPGGGVDDGQRCPFFNLKEGFMVGLLDDVVQLVLVVVIPVGVEYEAHGVTVQIQDLVSGDLDGLPLLRVLREFVDVVVGQTDVGML